MTTEIRSDSSAVDPMAIPRPTTAGMIGPIHQHSQRHPVTSLFWVFFSILFGLMAIVLAVVCFQQQHQRDVELQSLIMVPASSVSAIEQVLTQNQAAIKHLQQQVVSVSQQEAMQEHDYQQWVTEQHNILRRQAVHLRILAAILNLRTAQGILLMQGSRADASAQVTLALQSLVPILAMDAHLHDVVVLNEHVNSLPTIDTPEVMLGLQQLTIQLSTLQFKPAVAAVAEQPSVAQARGLTGLWQRSWQHLQGVIIIHRNDALSQALITQADRVDAIRHIQLLLTQAQMSAVQHNQVQYQALMAQVGDSVVQWTATNPAQAAWLQKSSALGMMPVGYSDSELMPIMKEFQALQNTLQAASVASDTPAAVAAGAAPAKTVGRG